MRREEERRPLYEPFVFMKLTPDDNGVRPWYQGTPANLDRAPTNQLVTCLRIVSHEELGLAAKPKTWSRVLELTITNSSPVPEGPLLVVANTALATTMQYVQCRGVVPMVPAHGIAKLQLSFRDFPDDPHRFEGLSVYNTHVLAQGPRLRLPEPTEWKVNRLCTYANVWPELLT